MKSCFSYYRFFPYLFTLLILIVLPGTVYGTVYTVTNTNDTGNGSFRWAILEANANAGADTVEFNIPGSGPHTIEPSTALPTLSETVVIDGYSQTDATPATVSNPAVLQIAVDGTSLGGSGVGIKISALHCEISGLCIRDCMDYGIHINISGGDALISGCYIGTDITGQNRAGGWDSSIYINHSSNNTIGGTNPASRNLISGNNGDGIEITNSSTGNVIQGNYIGTDVSGNSSLYNGGFGIYVSYASASLIGGNESGTGNVISGNHTSGITLYTTNVSGNVIQGNLIGTDRTGMIDMGNTYDGIALNNVQNMTIGGTIAATRNIISGNGDDGIDIRSGSSGNLVQGNYIGTDITGTAALGNDGYGVAIDGAPGNTIGGMTAGARNILSSNGNDGVGLFGSGATGNLVVGNYIGTDISGTVALGNAWEGVYIEEAPDNTIGGASPGARNIISSNGFISGSGGGVVIYGGDATGNLVQGNYIGTDVTGSLDMGNRRDGVGIFGWACDNTIGGTAQGAGNIISCNQDDGIDVDGTGNVLQGNYIGTNPTLAALGNTEDGVWLDNAYHTTVGGTAAGAPNVIAYNGECGVKVRYQANSILSNSIYTNGLLGIDLFPEGVSPNDPGDGDGGGNYLQNFPVLESVTIAGSNTIIEGALNSTPSDTFRIEFFFNTDIDASGYGEGEGFLGSTQIITDGGGDASFSVSFPTPIPDDVFITATATDTEGNTSEFSLAFIPLILSCGIVGGDVVLDWTAIPGAANYWVYGKTNYPWFVPDLTAPYANRVAVVLGGTTTWSSPAGVGDIDNTWIYLVVAVDDTDQALIQSNRCGEIDYEAENIPPR